jgi:hypothetical protein
MADLLTHVLVAYVLLTVVGWRVDAITPAWVAVGMGGAAIPDLVKIQILVDADVVGALLGTDFSFAPISTLAGVAVVAAAITLAFDRRYWWRTYAFLVAGGCSALVLDGLRAFADGRADFWLYPLWWRPPTPSLYVSSDPRVLATAVGLAGVVFLVDQYVVGEN